MRYFVVFVLAVLIASCQSEGGVEVIELKVEKDLISEGITVHPKTREIYLSSLHLDKIVHSDEEGNRVNELINSGKFGYSQGLGMEAKDKILYALGNYERTDQSRLFFFNFFDNQLFASVGLKDTKSKARFNDLAVDREGNVFMTDTKTHKIFVYNTLTASIELYLENEQIQNPNGIAISDDDSKLFIDSWTSGIRVVDIATGKILNEPHPATTEKGVDGLKYYKGDLYAIFNSKNLGRENHGLMKIELSEDESEVLKVSPILVNHPRMNIPTTFDIVDGDFYILANSQLHNLDEEENEIKNPEALTNTYILKTRVE